jgi:hypothetical protein
MGIGAKTKLLFFFSVSSAGGTEKLMSFHAPQHVQ